MLQVERRYIQIRNFKELEKLAGQVRDKARLASGTWPVVVGDHQRYSRRRV